ncbi:glycoside hydrolase family 15 protein [Altererythrobacter aurantiacus]|uniref:Glycoside hydrolase family 15 protein n=1 Tax=Parapontixanthobacter aurantiacus TaxID=1463599 RepID=A0A844ZIT9_9SPHN|nr:glycoside hydrolase family 15 protein [Parapontixanthobacter aurantiacus]MXO86900.1 glycoside hydrolase family 15 protein [Parapontixanthobacter aurantiacus]
MTETNGASEPGEAGGHTQNLRLWPIGNCQISTLIDERAGIVWGCVPRVDGDPVFCALLNGENDEVGVWRFELEGQVSAEQHYERNTAVLVTKLTAEDGSAVEIRDFCPRYENAGRMYRPVAVARIVRPVAGAPRLRVRLAPMRNYGSHLAATTHGTNHVRYLVGDQAMRLSTDAPVGYILEERSYRVEADQHFFLGPDEPFSGNVRSEVRRMLELTRKYWQLWVRGLATPMEWQDEVIRCAITLKLCQHEETGAIVAALTTSIPEAPGSQRNWDYRFCWIRDSYYTVQALNRLGALDVLEKYLAYLRNLVDQAAGGQIQPLYSVMGAAQLEEGMAGDLAGYRGMGPVRIGNAAYEQVQHDCYGQIVLPTAQAFFDRRLLRMADEGDFESLEQVGDMAWKMHDQPDAGLWEFRTRQEVHTYSAVMSWAACDRLANVAERLGKTDRYEFWQDRANRIRETIDKNAWKENGQGGHYTASFESDYLDASLLQLVELRFIDPSDERFLSTFAMIEKELRRGEHMLRYAAEDDFGAPETAFNICTFWLIEALHLVGRDEEARQLFEAMLAHRTPSGLLSEDLDFETGELWGNFPQTYSLVGIINCAGLLSRKWNAVR